MTEHPDAIPKMCTPFISNLIRIAYFGYGTCEILGSRATFTVPGVYSCRALLSFVDTLNLGRMYITSIVRAVGAG